MPHALTRMRTRPGVGVGMGMVSSLRTSGPPGECMTAASIVLAMVRVVVVVMVRKCLVEGGCCWVLWVEVRGQWSGQLRAEVRN